MSQEKYAELPLIPATPVSSNGPQQQSFKETAENTAVPIKAFLLILMPPILTASYSFIYQIQFCNFNVCTTI